MSRRHQLQGVTSLGRRHRLLPSGLEFAHPIWFLSLCTTYGDKGQPRHSLALLLSFLLWLQNIISWSAKGTGCLISLFLYGDGPEPWHLDPPPALSIFRAVGCLDTGFWLSPLSSCFTPGAASHILDFAKGQRCKIFVWDSQWEAGIWLLQTTSIYDWEWIPGHVCKPCPRICFLQLTTDALLIKILGAGVRITDLVNQVFSTTKQT